MPNIRVEDLQQIEDDSTERDDLFENIELDFMPNNTIMSPEIDNKLRNHRRPSIDSYEVDINPWPLVLKMFWCFLLLVAVLICTFTSVHSWFSLYVHQPGICGIADPIFHRLVWQLVSFSSLATITLLCYFCFYFNTLFDDLDNNRHQPSTDKRDSFTWIVILAMVESVAIGSLLLTLFITGSQPRCKDYIVTYFAIGSYYPVPSMVILALTFCYCFFEIIRSFIPNSCLTASGPNV